MEETRLLIYDRDLDMLREGGQIYPRATVCVEDDFQGEICCHCGAWRWDSLIAIDTLGELDEEPKGRPFFGVALCETCYSWWFYDWL